MIKMSVFTCEKITERIIRIRCPGNVFAFLALGDKKAALIDTGFGVYSLKEYVETLTDKPLTVLHREDLIECYLPSFYLKTRPGYQFDPQWDWSVRPCNTAFAYFAEEDFKNRYVDKAVDFMADNTVYPMEMVSQMVFAEQRLLAMEAHKAGLRINAIIKDPYQEDNDIFTHLWGAKRIARSNAEQRDLLVHAMMNKKLV